MLSSVIYFIIGLGFLLGGAELFVRGSSRLAEKIGVSSLVIGLTVVAFGTSAPELAIGIQSGFAGEADILIGNVVGSNIFNILLVLGGSALIAPLIVNKRLVRQDVPLLIGISLLLWVLCLDGSISFIESAFMTLLLVGYLWFTFHQGRKETTEEPPLSPNAVEHPTTGNGISGNSYKDHWLFQLLLIAMGLALLVVGADWLVDSSIHIARYLGVSSVIIGLTVVSLGTSLPEAATSLMAGLRGERDIAVGNIIGSNVFNILGIMGVSGMIIPGDIAIPASVIALDIPVMTAVAVACLPIFFTGYTIARWEGFVFFGYYLAYIGYLGFNAQEHEFLPLYNTAMLWFILPLTVITLAVITYREYKRKHKV